MYNISMFNFKVLLISMFLFSYGITRVLEDGDVMEKAAANISIIRGCLTEARAKVGECFHVNLTFFNRWNCHNEKLVKKI